MNAQFDNLKGRIATLRAGNVVARCGSVAEHAYRSVSLGSLAASMMGDDTTTPEVGKDFDRWASSLRATSPRPDRRKRQCPRYDFDVKGISVGVDYRQSANLVLGVALGYTRQATTLAAAKARWACWLQPVRLLHPLRENSWYVDGVVSSAATPTPIAGASSTSCRPDVDQMARASSDSLDTSATFTLGRDFNHKAWNFGLFGRAQFSNQEFDSFQEKISGTGPGTGLALEIEDRTVKSLSSVLGGKASYVHSAEWGVVMPSFGLEWQREYSGDPDAFRAFLISDPTGTPILITGDALDDSFFRFNFGFSVVLPRGRSGFLQYDRIFGRDGNTHENLSLGIRIEF